MGHVLIRPAGDRDLDLLAGIEEAADALFAARFGPGPAWGAALDGRARAGRPGFLLIAEDGGEPVGFVHVLAHGPDAHLEQLAVRPESARRGIGTALVREAVEVARSTGATRMTLRTYRDVPWNAPFYSRLGFVVVGADTDWLVAVERAEQAAGLDRLGVRVLMALPLSADPSRSPGTTRTAAEILAIARRAMVEILTEEERAAATARVVEPGTGIPFDERRVLGDDEHVGPEHRLLRITVLGESAWIWLSTEWAEDDDELFARIRSDLQDFVAESGFGWGQLRP